MSMAELLAKLAQIKISTQEVIDRGSTTGSTTENQNEPKETTGN